MSTLFGHIFACCLRSSSSSEGLTDEQRPLIPNGVESPTPIPQDTIVSDQQKVKERLGNIVRSKEGKMVNVTDHLPFNLHNRHIPAAASTSRLRTESPSPHPSVATDETTTTSQSGHSLNPRRSRPGLLKEPAHSVRIVKGREWCHRGSTSRGRLGKFGERGAELGRSDATDGAAGASLPKGAPAVRVSDQDAAPPEIASLGDGDKENIISLSEEIGRQLRDGWQIQDAGSISRGWSD